ncbi:MAG: tetratricopeptide repeat protein, partial [Microgenomates group bacterium]
MKRLNLASIILSFFVFLIPLFFLPLTVDFYDFNKNYLLWAGVVVGFLLWGVKALQEQKLEIKSSPFFLPLLFWVVAAVLSTIFSSPNKVEALLLPGGLGTIFGLFLFYFLILNLAEDRQKIFWGLVGAASVLSLVTIYQFFGLGETLIPSQSPFAFARPKNWTPAGSLLTVATFILVLLPSLLLFLKQNLKTSLLRATVFALVSLLLAGGAILAIYQMLPGKPAALTLLPYSSGWAIAVEAFKQNPLFGVGPTNFVSAFNRFRPVGFNRFDFWNLRFGTSSSFVFQLWTELGLVGLGAFLITVITVIKFIKIIKSPFFWGVVSFFLLSLFLPASLTLLFALFALLAIIGEAKEKISLQLPGNFRWLPLGGVILLFSPLVWFAARAYEGEIYFKKSLNALAKNDGLGTYNYQIKAIQKNPYRTDFRLAYSQTNLALANSLAANPPSGQLTDQDRANITQLIQQAIREARAATALGPTNAATWENLAVLYRQLLNFAQGADQWAIAAYQQAVVTDPINPRLRVDLGGLFYALGNYDEAQKVFRVAVELKPDYANGWYNLAAAYREDKKYPQAYQAMQQTLALVPADSPDWQKAKSELDELAKKLPSPTPTPTGAPVEKKQEEL